jgi:acyl carrier protein
METNDFIKNFADIFDDTDISEFTPETKFRDLDEWSSLHALATLNMIELKYSVKVTPDEMKTTNSINELYKLVVSKK